MNIQQKDRMQHAPGFIAALDQSGGSTPKALRLYGINEDAFSSEEEMFGLVHEMRTRIIKSPSFTSDHILGAILFENTMDRKIDGLYTADYLWDKKGIIPFLKIDQGLLPEEQGVQLMKPIAQLDSLLQRAQERHIFGTKMRSVIHQANPEAIDAVVKQQFAVAKTILSYGLVPIIEPEVDIQIPDKEAAEAILKTSLVKYLATLAADEFVIFKLSIPTKVNLYEELMAHPNVIRVVALSGGYSRETANHLLAQNHGLIASFSRALSEGLTAQLTAAQFDQILEETIASIYQASIQ